jgi:hypothetical protein
VDRPTRGKSTVPPIDEVQLHMIARTLVSAVWLNAVMAMGVIAWAAEASAQSGSTKAPAAQGGTSAGMDTQFAGPPRLQVTCVTREGTCEATFSVPVAPGMPCPCTIDRTRQVWGRTR